MASRARRTSLEADFARCLDVDGIVSVVAEWDRLNILGVEIGEREGNVGERGVSVGWVGVFSCYGSEMIWAGRWDWTDVLVLLFFSFGCHWERISDCEWDCVFFFCCWDGLGVAFYNVSFPSLPLLMILHCPPSFLNSVWYPLLPAVFPFFGDVDEDDRGVFSIVVLVVTVVTVVILVGFFFCRCWCLFILRGTFSFYLELPGSTLLPFC